MQWRQGDAVILAEANGGPDERPAYCGDAGGSANRLPMLFDFSLNGRLMLADHHDFPNRLPLLPRPTEAPFLVGMRTLEKGATVPSHWSDEALEKLRSLVDLRNNGVASMTFSSPGETAVEPTLHTAANIDVET
ncbi:hypothetical protein B4Q13_14995 [Lacticaseibacillus rhamnosus]